MEIRERRPKMENDFASQLKQAQIMTHNADFVRTIAPVNNHPVDVSDIEFAINCTRDQLFVLAMAAHSAARNRAASPEPKPEAETPKSVGCDVRGHVWNNYNREFANVCIVCGAEAETPKE